MSEKRLREATEAEFERYTRPEGDCQSESGYLSEGGPQLHFAGDCRDEDSCGFDALAGGTGSNYPSLYQSGYMLLLAWVRISGGRGRVRL